MVAEITSVVPTTRSCRLRRQRCLALPMTRCSRRSTVRIRIVMRCGSQATTQRTSLLRRSAISHASRTSRWVGACCAVSAASAACSGAVCGCAVSGWATPGWAACAGAATGGAAVACAFCASCDGAPCAGAAATGGDAATAPAASGFTADRSMPWSAGSRLVPNAADRYDDLGVLRVFFDLGPEPLHVHVHQPGVRCMPVAPDLLQEHLAGEDLSRLAGQRDQQVELERREAERLAVTLDGVPGHVDRNVPDLQHLRRRLVGPPEPRSDPGDELLRL